METHRGCHQAFRRGSGIPQEEVGLVLRKEGCIRWIGVGPLKNRVFFRNKGCMCDALELGGSVCSQ